jgi:glutamate-ammonia-ligase adenylyltransferase
MINQTLPAELESHQQSTAETFLKTIQDTALKQLSDADQQDWLKMLVCSDFAMRQLNHHKDAIARHWQAGLYQRALGDNEMSDLLAQQIDAVNNEQQLLQVLRQFRNQQMIRITYRDINGLAELNETLNDLTELANCTVNHALSWLDTLQQKEFGTPLDSEGRPISLIVIGMGKLGAYELNFSSDVDLIFAFSEHGETVNGPRRISHNEYFIKLGQRLINALDKNTADGFVFRVDMRLRPFGQSGPLVVTYGALEDYYSTHGREWERYALIKARIMTGPDSEREYLQSLLTPFVYRRYIDFGVFESLRDMKSMIVREVKQKKKEHNVKLGAGGIREIEFLAQAFQLLRGGRDKQLQERQVQKVLAYLGKQGVIPDYVVKELLYSYDFLRKTEHRIQQMDDKQTHNLPEYDFPRARIAYGMGFSDWDSFSEALQNIRDKVQGHFEHLLESPQADDGDNQQDEVQGIWQGILAEEQASETLNKLGYSDGMEVVRLLSSFRNSHSYRKMSKEGSARLDKLMPLVLKAIAHVDDSETTFKRVMDVIESVCRRSVYLALLVENPLGLSQLVRLCAASSWISRLLSRHPALFDELLDARVLYSPLDKAQLMHELQEKISTVPMDDLEQRMELLRHFKQSQILRVAAADVTGVIPVMKVSDYLTWIAETILHFVLQTAWCDMKSRFGEPQLPRKSVDMPAEQQMEEQESPQFGQGFAMLGFGKLGGIELGYSSDLDMVFLFANEFSGGNTDGERSVDNLQFYSKLSLRVMHILQTQMPSGILYEADMRLRPNGNSGLIINSIKAFREYELEKAWTWEHQALVRARFVGGDQRMLKPYQAVRQEILGPCREKENLRKEVREMRTKMRLALAKKTAGIFDIKQGFGGIADIEFIVQFMVLNNACHYPELLTWTDNIRVLEVLGKTGLLSEQITRDLSDCYRLFRDRLHQLSLQEVSGTVADDEFQQERKKIQAYWCEIMEPDNGVKPSDSVK